VARQADVSMLALTHLSSRYFAPVIEKEAQEVFDRVVVPRDFDVIEVPYRERGEPVAMSLRDHRERTRPTRC
jgi:ribonuclease Z